MGRKSVLILTIVTILIRSLEAQNTGQLVFVNVLFRHGDRAPVEPYPNDPYNDTSYWPNGWGQLTNKGLKQHYALGQWLRKRYSGFLPDHYSLQDIYVRSTDVDRTLMSAETNLAGLYPLTGKYIWDPNLKLQPVPIHTVPEKEDPVLAAKKRCPRYDLELNNLLNTEEFKIIYKKIAPLFQYLTNNTGTHVSTIQELEYIFDTLHIESLYGLKLPDWTKEVFPDKMTPWSQFAFRINCYTERLQRLKVGLLVNEIVTRFVTKSKDRLVPNRKMWVYSAHDTTVANILMAFGAFDSHPPPYASTIIMELSTLNSSYFVSVFYKNDTDAHPISILGCEQSCPLEKVVDLLHPIILSTNQWELECQSLTGPMVSTIAAIAVISCGVLLLLLLISLCVGATLTQKQKHGNQLYQPLSDEIN